MRNRRHLGRNRGCIYLSSSLCGFAVPMASPFVFRHCSVAVHTNDGNSLENTIRSLGQQGATRANIVAAEAFASMSAQVLKAAYQLGASPSEMGQRLRVME